MGASAAAERPFDIAGPLKVRATGFFMKDDAILLVRQALRERSRWNLPGGGLEAGETLGQCLVREMQEETGLRVKAGELLYVCDRFKELNAHVLDISFLVTCSDDDAQVRTDLRTRDERLDAVRMVPLSKLGEYGFSAKFIRLVQEGFPGKGEYQGDFHEFYG